MFGARLMQRGVNTAGVRRMGGWIRTNVRTEENAGLRESSYKTWEFDPNSVSRLIMYMFVPGALFYFVAKDEMIGRSKQVGNSIAFGMSPTDSEKP